MKKLLLVVLSILSLNASAGIIAEASNKGGGSIALTDIKCTTVKDTYVAYSYLSNGQSLLGCWAGDGSRVFIRWSDGDVRSYPLDVFEQPKDSYGRKYM